jgi:hypothetical protein
MPAHRRPSDTYDPAARVPVSFRLRPSAKARVEQRVSETGRTLANEFEGLIDWALDHQDRLGGPRAAALLEAMAQAALSRHGPGWIDDPAAFGQVEKMWQGMLRTARPVTDERQIRELLGAIEAAREQIAQFPQLKRELLSLGRWIASVQAADDERAESLSDDDADRTEEMAPLIADKE